MRCVVKVVARIIFGFNCLALIFSAVVAFLIDFSHQTPYSPVIERIMERGFCSSSSSISISIFHLYLYPYLWPSFNGYFYSYIVPVSKPEFAASYASISLCLLSSRSDDPNALIKSLTCFLSATD